MTKQFEENTAKTLNDALDGLASVGADIVVAFIAQCGGDPYEARRAFRSALCDVEDSVAPTKPIVGLLTELVEGFFCELIDNAKPYDVLPNALEIYLGDFYDDYDIKSIEDDVLWTNPENGNRYYKSLTEEAFAKIVSNHEIGVSE